MNLRSTLTASLLISALLIDAAYGHDFWIEPSTFGPALGENVSIALRVGEAFGGKSYRRNPPHIKQFFLRGPEQTSNVPGQPGADPAGQVKIMEPGVQIIGYQSAYALIELPAERFEDYLREEHLDQVIESRRTTNTSSQPGREAFARYAKSILNSGESAANHGGYDQSLGFPLELIPRQNPYSLSPGDELVILVSFMGAPLPNARVMAYNKDDRDRPLLGVTDNNGEVKFSLDLAGTWLIRCLHAVEAAETFEVDWESFWASLTFAVPR